MKKIRRKVFVALAMAAAVLGLGACSSLNPPQTHDLKHVTFQEPDETTGWVNVDGHPNVVRLCLDGVAFASTTRSYTNLFRVEAWDAHCAAVAASR